MIHFPPQKVLGAMKLPLIPVDKLFPIKWQLVTLSMPIWSRVQINSRSMTTVGLAEARQSVKIALRSAVKQLQARGLQKAATWTLEQIVGIDVPSSGQQPRVDVYEQMQDDSVDVLMLARSFLDAGEYQRCAFYLQSNKAKCSDAAAVNLFLFMLSYARYMAGAKLREQLILENDTRPQSDADADAQAAGSGKTKVQRKADKGASASNSNLQAIYNDLLPLYKQGTMDGFLLYIFAVVARDLQHQQGVSVAEVLGSLREREGLDPGSGDCGGLLSVRALFIEAIQAYPWNWSCWLELSDLCVSEKQALPTWQELTDLENNRHCNNNTKGVAEQLESAKIMYACFLVHAYLEKHCGDLAVQVLQAAVLPIMPHSLPVQTQVGLAQYTQRQYDAAEESFEGVRQRDPYRLACMDTYSNILYVKEKHADLARLAHAVVEVEKFCPESCCVVGNHYSLKGKHERAVLYFQRAIKLNSRYLSAWTLMGHEYMELRNTAAAVQCYRNAVAISEADYRAWYGLGQTYEMLHLYQYAHFYYRKAAYLRPMDARMWGAVGNCLLKLGLREQAIQSFERAVGCGDLEGIATRDLARLCREEGQTARAAQFYFRFLQICHFFQEGHSDGEEGGAVSGGSGGGVHAAGAELQRTAPRRANSGDGHASTGSGSAALLSAVLNPSAMGGGLDNNNTSTYISKAVSALISQQQQVLGGGGEAGSAGGTVTAVDGEQAEALLYLAQYHHSIGALPLASLFCSRLQGYMGTEGDEARALMRAIQTSGPLPRPPGGIPGTASATNTSRTSSATGSGRRSRRDLSNISAFTRSSARRQSTGYAYRGGGDATPPARGAGAEGMEEGDSSGAMDMTPSQSLQMEYTALSLSPADSAEVRGEAQRSTRRF